MTSRPSTTQRGYGHDHQLRRQQLLYNHRDGTECDYCGEPMYRDKGRNFDGAPLNADHEALDKAKLANRLLHDTCNKKMNHADKWVKHGPGWYAKHGQPMDESSDLDWPGGIIIDPGKVAPGGGVAEKSEGHHN